MRRAAHRVALLLVVLTASAALVAGAGATSASAAAEIVSSDPTNGSTVPGTVSEVRLTFNAPVTTPAVQVMDSGGRRVDGVPRVEANQIVVPIDADVRTGQVTVEWRARAAGERLEGELRFTIATAVPRPEAVALTGAARTRSSADDDTRADDPMADRAAWAALRGAGLVAIMLAVGAGLFTALVHDGLRDRRRVAAATVVAGLAGVGLVGGAALLGDAGELSRRETLSLGLLAAGTFLVALGTVVARPGRSLPRAVVLAGAVVTGAGFLPSGHSSAAERPVLAMGALGVHILGMGAWLGGIAALVLTLAHRRHVRSVHREALLLRRFATLAAVAVGAGLLGGLLVVVLMLPAVSSLWSTEWGLVVLGKTAAVLVVLALAAFNRGARVPPELPPDKTRPLLAERLAATPEEAEAAALEAENAAYADDADPPGGPSRRRLRVRIGAEALVLAAAAAASGALVQEDPGAGAREYVNVVAMGDRVAAVTSEDLTAGRPVVKVWMRTYGGRTDIKVNQLSIRLSGPDGTPGPRRDLVRPKLRETFDAELDVPMSGRWTIELSYRVSDVDRGEATLVLPVG